MEISPYGPGYQSVEQKMNQIVMCMRRALHVLGRWNPFTSIDGRISITTTIVYVAAVASVVVSSIRLPSLPTDSESSKGINITEAWDDLSYLSQRYHPFISYDLDAVHDWLVQRVQSILADNHASAPSAYLFDDNTSNLTFYSAKKYRPEPISAYFEAKNVIVYIRGTNDDQSNWWETPSATPSHNHSVLIDAHYDTGSTAYGATDDGTGIVSMLQLIRYFTTSGNTPKYGVVLLMNSGEENGLNGARVFSQHPMSRAVSRFVNLEGAGAGGRAAAFRMTDISITTAYAKSPYPFGNVASAEAFKRGIIKSGTDFTVLNETFGYQGIDIAFIGPRARYHTNQDDIHHTSKQAVWHMLSAVLATTISLSESAPNEKPDNRVIWFDVLGRTAIVMHENTWFQFSVIMLIIGPVIIMLTLAILSHRAGLKLSVANRHNYTVSLRSSQLGGTNLSSFLAFPFILFASSSAPMGIGFTIYKLNPFIIYNSKWAVWTSMVSSFVLVAWYSVHSIKGPSKLMRACSFTWISAGWWFMLFAATVLLKLSKFYALYFTLFYFAALLAATWLSYLDLFSDGVELEYMDSNVHLQPSTFKPIRIYKCLSILLRSSDKIEECEEKITETSSLLRPTSSMAEKCSEATSCHQSAASDREERKKSKMLSDWLWIFELLIVVPPSVVVVGQVGIYLVDSVNQTSSDGNSPLTAYLGMASLTPLIFSPLIAFLHNFPRRFASLILLVLLGSLMHNFSSRAFDSDHRLKFSFQQQLNLAENTSIANLVGVRHYLQEALSTLPNMPTSGATCERYGKENLRDICSWSGSVPNLTSTVRSPGTNTNYINPNLVQFSTTLISDDIENKTVRFTVSGLNTRACKLQFNSRITDFHVAGQGPIDERFKPVPADGVQEIRLWSRTWDRTWLVDVTWPPETHGQNKTGKVVCLWADANQAGTIPVFDDLIDGLPSWATFMSLGDGLVEAFYPFEV